jgi:hypothetical protein
LVAIVQHFLTRRSRQDAESRQTREDELRRERAVDEREELLAEARATSQHTALKSAEIRYRGLYRDYAACRHGIAEIANATGILIDVFEGFLSRFRQARAGGEAYTATMQTEDMTHARKAISEARKHLTPGIVPWTQESAEEEIDE